jgi:hypothetical protein
MVNNYAILVNFSDPTVLVYLLSRFLLITLSLVFLGTFLFKLRYSFLLQTDQGSWVWGRVSELNASYFMPLFCCRWTRDPGCGAGLVNWPPAILCLFFFLRWTRDPGCGSGWASWPATKRSGHPLLRGRRQSASTIPMDPAHWHR